MLNTSINLVRQFKRFFASDSVVHKLYQNLLGKKRVGGGGRGREEGEGEKERREEGGGEKEGRERGEERREEGGGEKCRTPPDVINLDQTFYCTQ